MPELFTPLLLLAAFVVVLSLAIWSISASLPTIRRRFRCPFNGTDVVVDFVCHPATLRNVDVKSCSAFRREEGIACDKECLKLDTDEITTTIC